MDIRTPTTICHLSTLSLVWPLMEERRERRARWCKKGGRDGSPAMFRILLQMRKPASVRAKLLKYPSRSKQNSLPLKILKYKGHCKIKLT